tara:strand:+ start:2995 stop:3495 length:501 start_codon:yes stop_codon:yes gene_type:complete
LKFSKILSGLILFTAASLSYAENYSDLAKPFFKYTEKGEYRKAVNSVLESGKPWISEQSIKEIGTQFESLKEMLGTYYGYEKILELNIKNRMVLEQYLARFERQPIIVEFIYYKPNDNWRVNNFLWTDELDDYMQEHAKFSIFSERYTKPLVDKLDKYTEKNNSNK